MPLFTRYRSSFGEERPLIDVPGHLLEPHDDEEAVSILAMSLLFFWDCYVLPISKRGTFFTSHDESCWLIGSSEDALLSAQTSFETFIQNDTEH